MKSSNYDSLMQIMGKKRKDLQKIKEENSYIKEDIQTNYEYQKDLLILPNSSFEYESLGDAILKRELQEKEKTLKDIFSRAYTQMGKTLKEAQDLLSSHDKTKGIFEAWYTSLGFKKDSVYRLISRFNLLANCEEREKDIIEIIPISLAYEISKSSCPSLLKENVLKGKIKNLKEFKEAQKNILDENFSKNKKLKYFGIKEIQKEKIEIISLLEELLKNNKLKELEEENLVKAFYIIKKSKNNLKKIKEFFK